MPWRVITLLFKLCLLLFILFCCSHVCSRRHQSLHREHHIVCGITVPSESRSLRSQPMEFLKSYLHHAYTNRTSSRSFNGIMRCRYQKTLISYVCLQYMCLFVWVPNRQEDILWYFAYKQVTMTIRNSSTKKHETSGIAESFIRMRRLRSKPKECNASMCKEISVRMWRGRKAALLVTLQLRTNSNAIEKQQ